MFDKVKELLKVQQEIEEIKAQTAAQTKAMSEFGKQFETVAKNLENVQTSMNNFIEEFTSNKEMIANVREDLGKEVYEFKLLKSQLQRKIIEKFEDEMQKELKVNVDTLKKDMADYEDVKKAVQEAVKNVNLTKEEMDKWLAISTNIKQADFDLVKHAKVLERADQEKLELMKKIDSLQTLVARMRRHNPQGREQVKARPSLY